MISVHRYDNGQYFPGEYGNPKNIGSGKGKGYNIFVGFDATDQEQNGLVSDNEYIYATSKLLLPIIKDFDPELIIVSCGFDAAIGDPYGGIGVTPVGYAWLTQALQQICSKVLVNLEGGYCLEAIKNSSEAVIKTLLTHPKDEKSFNKLVEELGAEKGTNFESLVKRS